MKPTKALSSPRGSGGRWSGETLKASAVAPAFFRRGQYSVEALDEHASAGRPADLFLDEALAAACPPAGHPARPRIPEAYGGLEPSRSVPPAERGGPDEA